MLKSPPRKTARSRRKKPEPLAEISSNVRRGRTEKETGDHAAPSAKLLKSKHRPDQDTNSDMPISLGPFRPTSDIFRDDESKGGTSYLCWPDAEYLTCEGPVEGVSFVTQSERDQR